MSENEPPKKDSVPRVQTCYAAALGDCSGQLTDEHWIPRSIQKMLGPVMLEGLLYRGRVASRPVDPGTYAHDDVICAHHHEQLNGLDGNARDYFRNLMLLAGMLHLSTAKIGRLDEIARRIDGRKLERWMLKLICGAVHAGAASAGDKNIPRNWLLVLFGHESWPDHWRLRVENLGEKVIGDQDKAFETRFAWRKDGSLLGIFFVAFGVTTMLNLADIGELVRVRRRPRGLGFNIRRVAGGDILIGAPEGTEINFTFDWPPDPSVVEFSAMLPAMSGLIGLYQSPSWLFGYRVLKTFPAGRAFSFPASVPR